MTLDGKSEINEFSMPTNINNLKTGICIYGVGATNSPLPSNTILVIASHNSSSDTACQIAIPFDNSVCVPYIRYKADGVWSS